jgi:hypothetical protein
MCFASVIHQELPVMIQLISHAGAKLPEISHRTGTPVRGEAVR